MLSAKRKTNEIAIQNATFNQFLVWIASKTERPKNNAKTVKLVPKFSLNITLIESKN
jgi:hypothetical protein